MSDDPREDQPGSRLDELPSIRTDSDDRSTYRRSGRAETPKQSNFNGILVFIIFLMLVLWVLVVTSCTRFK